MLVTGSQKTTVLKGTTFVDTLLGWGVTQNANGSVTEDITKVAHESMFGNSGNDKLYGGAGNDKLYGEVGNDILNGGSGNDFLDGGSGTDTAIFKSSANAATFDWNPVSKTLTVKSGDGVDSLINIENLQFGGQTFKTTDVVIAGDDKAEGTEGTLNISAASLLMNDFTFRAGAPLTIQIGSDGYVGQTTEGANIYLEDDGKLHFVSGESTYSYLEKGESMVTHFSYTVGNGTGLTDTANVALTITGVDQLSFEAGLDGWQTTGISQTIGTDTVGSHIIVPTEGAMQGKLTSTGTDQSDLEVLLGLASGSLDSLGVGNATNGSAIKTTISAAAGTMVSFDWCFVANDYMPYNDFGFFVDGDGNASVLSSISSVGDYGSSGWQTASLIAPITADGSFEIGFGVMNTGDSGVNSYLYVDNILIG